MQASQGLQQVHAEVAGPAGAQAPGPEQLDASSTAALADDAVVWATQHGLVVGAGGAQPGVAVVHAPLSVLPTPFPRASFDKACAAAPAFNSLIDAVARDGEYLQSTLRLAAQYDDFTARLLEVYRATAEVRAARAASELVLAVNRSDYMLDQPSATLLQVELNTIASSFGCLSTLVSRLHAYLVPRAPDRGLEAQRVPANSATEEIADAMAAAHAEYGCAEAVVLMVVQPGERNSYDQQWIQTTLWERHRVRTLRRTLGQLAEAASLAPRDGAPGGQLRVAGAPVAVVYLRAGYSPDDYPTQAEWDARTLLERSDAALCPSVAYQLAGAKKVQQDLARPGVVERFLPDPDQAALVRACFAGQWALDDPAEPATAEVIAAARAQPELYVLKPQREGGGNNLYGAQLADRLARPAGLAAYILMQRIRPPVNPALMVREGRLAEVASLSELGVYGTLLRRGGHVLRNRQAGHLLRTKAATSDEGGVAAGFAVLDSPYLVD